MWPSEDVVNRLYDLSNAGLIVGLVLGVVCTVMVVWMGNKKEEYLRTRIANIGSEAAKANLRAAELQAASLPRTFNPGKLADEVRRFAGTTASMETLGEFEPARLMALIQSDLAKAGWRIGTTGMTTGVPPARLSRPGVWIEPSPLLASENGGNGEIKRSPKEIASKLADLTKVAEALVSALKGVGIEATLRPPSPESQQDGTIHVYVGIRPFPGMPEDLRVTQ